MYVHKCMHTGLCAPLYVHRCMYTGVCRQVHLAVCGDVAPPIGVQGVTFTSS